jgi:hypothetical protein
MKIDLKIDTKVLEARTLREARRLAFNTAEAINKTALEGQKLVREEISANMTLRADTKRNRKFLLEQVKVAFASARKGLAFAEVYIAKKARLLLAAFETREQREGFVGKGVAVPNPDIARAGGSNAGAVKDEFTFKRMKLKKTGRFHDGKEILEGASGTFQTKTDAQPRGAVFQRQGDDVRLVWSFARPFRLKKLIHFKERITRAMKDKFKVEWAIANAKDQLR